MVGEEWGWRYKEDEFKDTLQINLSKATEEEEEEEEGGNKEGGQRAQEPQWRRIRTRHFVKVVIQRLELTQLIGIEGAIGESIKEGNGKG